MSQVNKGSRVSGFWLRPGYNSLAIGAHAAGQLSMLALTHGLYHQGRVKSLNEQARSTNHLNPNRTLSSALPSPSGH